MDILESDQEFKKQIEVASLDDIKVFNSIDNFFFSYSSFLFSREILHNIYLLFNIIYVLNLMKQNNEKCFD